MPVIIAVLNQCSSLKDEAQEAKDAVGVGETKIMGGMRALKRKAELRGGVPDYEFKIFMVV